MTDNLPHLRSLAEAATPGPWFVAEDYDPERPMPSFDEVIEYVAEDHIAASPALDYRPNAEFIATFNPQTVLQLLDRLEAAETALANRGAVIKGSGYGANEDAMVMWTPKREEEPA